MLTKAQKSEWIQRLRSNQYTQGHKYLRRIIDGNQEQWCCLGVLSEQLYPGKGEWSNYENCFLYQGQSQFPSFHEIEGWEDIAKKLADMNDDRKDFITISNYIEEHVPTSD